MPLLTALRCAADPAELTPEIARVLLLSPLGGADAGDLRRLGRALRAEERLAATRLPATPTETTQTETTQTETASVETTPTETPPAGGSARPAAELIREAVADPRILTAFDDRVAGPARRLGRLLADARAVLTAGGSAEEALWRIWDGTPWPRRLERTAYRGGSSGRAADRDLDAVCALFDMVGRTEGWGEHGARNFLAELEAQAIPGDTLAEQAVRGDAVRLLTAHRSKGLEWRLVVVADVQEGLWPDLRRRGSVLEADRIGPDGLTPPLSGGAILAEERRLFYVAVTRASERVVVTAVRSPQDDGEQPSRFLDELGVEPVDVLERPRRPLSPAGLVAELRATLTDPEASEPLRRAAAVRLAALAGQTDADGYPLVPAADPRRWWGLAESTDPGVPVRDPAAPVKLSGSAVSALASCPLRWFLGREAHAAAPPSGEVGFGRIVHVLADDVAQGRTPPELDALTERLERVWNQLAFEARWRADQQKLEARAALGRFLNWHLGPRGREPVATEHPFSVTLTAGGREVTVSGSMDRVERDSEGRAHVVDFKTGKSKASPAELREHPQLGVYQLAVQAGALDDLPAFGGDRPAPGGAELVQLRHDAGGLPVVQQQAELTSDEDGTTWVQGMVGDAAGRVLAEDFSPITGSGCDRCEFRKCCPAWPEGRQVVE
jgi:RecB family exonuclease